jgi:hypothetical protein
MSQHSPLVFAHLLDPARDRGAGQGDFAGKRPLLQPSKCPSAKII